MDDRGGFTSCLDCRRKTFSSLSEVCRDICGVVGDDAGGKSNIKLAVKFCRLWDSLLRLEAGFGHPEVKGETMIAGMLAVRKIDIT